MEKNDACAATWNEAPTIWPKVLPGNVEKSWETGSDRGLQRLVQRFGNRAHLLGIAIYDGNGKAVAVTPQLASILMTMPPQVKQAIAAGRLEDSFTRIGDGPVHIFAVPLHRQDEIVGGLAVVHDTPATSATKTSALGARPSWEFWSRFS